ncbi:hypothetical protein ABK046_20640, partial [Streptomyces caeruleatus]
MRHGPGAAGRAGPESPYRVRPVALLPSPRTGYARSRGSRVPVPGTPGRAAPESPYRVRPVAR